MAKYDPKAQKKVEETMREFKKGELESGKSGKSVKAANKQWQSVWTKLAELALKFRRRSSWFEFWPAELYF